MRDLIRTRKQAMDALKVARQQLPGFLLRHGLRYRNGRYRTRRHRRRLTEPRRFRSPHQQRAFEELKRVIDRIEARVATPDQAIEAAVMDPLVDSRRCG